jgi:hypothetical protein
MVEVVMGKKQSRKAARRRAEPQGQPPAAEDAPPSNTASHGYENGKWEYKLLRVGVDSLYLSYYGDLYPGVETELAQRKFYAQSRDPDQRALAQWIVGQHVFEVPDKGQPRFAYCLQDNAYRISLRSGESGRLPLAYAKLSSELLSHKPLEIAVEELGQVIGDLGESDTNPIVSRIDLFADFQTDVDIGAIPRHAWITQASGIDTYSRGGKFTGWVFGAGSAMSARLYDKTAEIQKSHKTYLYDLWRRSGWDGESSVWRLEFQFRRELLASFRISTFSQILDKLGGLWLGATGSWLRLTVPDPDDSNRARWPLHPIWQYVNEIRWRLDDEPLTRSYTPARIPALEKLYRMYIATLTSYMAVKGINVYGEGCIGLMEDSRKWFEPWCRDQLEIAFDDWLDQKLRLKVREFNTRKNVRTIRQESETSDEVEKDAADYYRKSRGE